MFSYILQLRKLWRKRLVSSKKVRTLPLELEALEERAVPALLPPPWVWPINGSYNVAFTAQFGPEAIDSNSTDFGMQQPSANLVFSGPYWSTAQGQQDEAEMIAAAQSILSGRYLSGLTQYGSDGTAFFGRSWNDSATVPLQGNLGRPSTNALQAFL
jgi:hypothetical protein